jgi:hypothetical protein
MGQVITRPAFLEACGCLPHQSLHELTGAGQSGHGCRTLALDTGRGHGTGYRTRGHQARGRWTRTRTPDTGHVPDAGHWTGGRWTCGRGQGHQSTVGIRISWYYDTAGTATRVAVAGTRGVRQPWRLDGEVPASARLLAVPPRAAKRQAAPFSRASPSPTPSVPGAGPARPTVGTRTASRPSASARSSPSGCQDAAPADYPVRGSRRPLPLMRPAVQPRHPTQTSARWGRRARSWVPARWRWRRAFQGAGRAGGKDRTAARSARRARHAWRVVQAVARAGRRAQPTYQALVSGVRASLVVAPRRDRLAGRWRQGVAVGLRR